MNHCLLQYYRCPEDYVSFILKGEVSEGEGYFRFGNNILYGSTSGGKLATSPMETMTDLSLLSEFQGQTVCLPFDVANSLDTLRYETYHPLNGHHPANSILGRAYYVIRPVLPVKVRRHLQKIQLNGWREFTFPNWPVDATVDNTLQDLLLLSLRASKVTEIPFIWFWPDGASGCAIVTHDVEAVPGKEFCGTLMDIDESFAIHGSFQIVPEERYEVTPPFLDEIRKRGFEINVQDLNHDGRLFRTRDEFLARVKKINAYGKEYRAEGFRAAILYRRQEWYDELEFAYDMSVPNVAHLDPQRGGCCTVMPYFIGDLVELPVTMTQDYSLFHILNDYSIDLWKQQCDLVMSKNGLIHFIVHPDYITAKAERATYEKLLRHLKELQAKHNIWMPLPREVASWWKQRSKMQLVKSNGAWKIEGEGHEHARVAYARENSGRLIFSFEPANNHVSALKAQGALPVS
jgi:hypothetical protein